MSQITYSKLLTEQIRLYYLKSFRTPPEELGELFTSIIESLIQVCAVDNVGQKLNGNLVDMLEAQQRRDFVCLRDILWYEIKPYFEVELG